MLSPGVHVRPHPLLMLPGPWLAISAYGLLLTTAPRCLRSKELPLLRVRGNHLRINPVHTVEAR